MNIRENKGITLVALTIAVIILVIIAGISVAETIIGEQETDDSSQMSEVIMVQHAILERYTKAQLTKEELPGKTIQKSEVQTIIDEINSATGENITLKGTEYKELSKADLENLGITKEDDTFIVNYKTGEVINKTIKVTELGTALYTYSKSE